MVTADTREGYIGIAQHVEAQLQVRQRYKDHQNLGKRDTFPFEERSYLAQVLAEAFRYLAKENQTAGSVYSASIDNEAHVGLYRLEITTIPGTGKLRTPATIERQWKESSALHDRLVQPTMVILGDITIQGSIKGLTSIQEPLQVAVDNGAIRALVPIANKNQFAALPEEIIEKLELVVR